jgi:hypothetical protein
MCKIYMFLKLKPFNSSQVTLLKHQKLLREARGIDGLLDTLKEQRDIPGVENSSVETAFRFSPL